MVQCIIICGKFSSEPHGKAWHRRDLKMVAKKPVNPLKAGDRVRILHSDNWLGRIVEERGPLGPGGMLVFRVRIPRKPKPTYIEVCEDQLVAMPKPPKVG